MIIDGQIIVILNYPLTLLKPMVDIQCLQMQYIFVIINYKVAIKIFHQLNTNKLKETLTNFFLNRYN